MNAHKLDARFTLDSVHVLYEFELHLRPVLPAMVVSVHAEEQTQRTRQALRLLLQQIRLRLALETCSKQLHDVTPSHC